MSNVINLFRKPKLEPTFSDRINGAEAQAAAAVSVIESLAHDLEQAAVQHEAVVSDAEAAREAALVRHLDTEQALAAELRAAQQRYQDELTRIDAELDAREDELDNVIDLASNGSFNAVVQAQRFRSLITPPYTDGDDDPEPPALSAVAA